MKKTSLFIIGIAIVSVLLSSQTASAQSSRSRNTFASKSRTKAVWKSYIQHNPANHYKMEILTFPKPGSASSGTAEKEYFDIVRKHLDEIEDLDLAGVSPDVAKHIRRSSKFWRKICKMAPDMERTVAILMGKANAASEAGGEIGARHNLPPGIGQGVGMLWGLRGLEKYMDAHVRKHGQEAFLVISQDMSFCRKLKVSPENVAKGYEHLSLALSERGMRK